jgi:FkbH-like protein
MKRLLTISDFNVNNFNAFLCNSEEQPAVCSIEVPFGQVHQLLVDRSAGCWTETPDCVVVWTQPQGVIQSFNRALKYEGVEPDVVLEEVEQFAELLVSLKDRAWTVLVPSWVLPSYDRGLGLLDLRHNLGITNLLMRMNLRLSEKLDHEPNFFILNTHRWIEVSGYRAFNPKLWYMAKVPFGNCVFQEAAKDVKAALQAVGGKARKLVVVDLDDTLWGGIVGDLGWENLTLGGHDPEGEAYCDFQAALKALTNRGVLLGIVSKNEESVALEAINLHPEMMLRQEDFAGWRINWKDKAQNVADLVGELNLGLQSVVFIDDNPAERARVREALPEVFVPEWPSDKMHYRRALLELGCFDTPSLTAEDRERVKMYARERERKTSMEKVGSLEDWLHTLNVKVEVERINQGNLARAAQLLNKTNQMNLSTRRMTESELLAWGEAPGNCMWAFRVSDKFGSMGVTGLLSVEVGTTVARVVDFVLSCRVMGRKVEETMLATAIRHLQSRGVPNLYAKFLPTQKNMPCLEFLKRSGLRHQSSGHNFSWDTSIPYPYPEHVTVEFKES